MNQLQLMTSPFVQVWTTVLLHFVWQGTAIAIAVRLVLGVIPEKNSRARYRAGITGLLAMLAVPAATFWTLESEVVKNLPHSSQAFVVPTHVGEVSFQRIPRTLTNAEANSETPLDVPLLSYVPPLRIGLFCVWLVAQAILGSRLLFGAVVVWRIRRTAEQVSDELQVAVSRLAKRMGMRRAPEILRSWDMADAATVGFLKATVVVPAAWIGQMTPEMLEAVLAHELSHIRRHDVWLNLLQRIMETVFFYHPGVWWLSEQIRVEREYCCDADAVAVTDDGKAYARTLEEAARYGTGQQFALVSNLGGKRMTLLKRVNRVLGRRTDSAVNGQWSVGVLALLVPLLIALTMSRSESFAVDPPDPIALSQTDDVNDPPAPESQNTIGIDPASPRIARHVPSETTKISLPDYIIEPPDILYIEGVRLVERSDAKLHAADVLQIVVRGTPADRPIAGQYEIESNGTVNLGPGYGNAKVAGLSTEVASTAIRETLLKDLNEVEVAVSVLRKAGQQVITGEHLVAPDGTVNLGIHGRVFVARKTIEEAKAAVEKLLSKSYESPVVSLNLFVSNSKFFYVITELDDGPGAGTDSVARIPITGHETVLDAFATIGGLSNVSRKNIWVSRPAADGDRIIPVDWEAITRGAATQTNYQLFTGDRLFISSRPPRGHTPEKIEHVAGEFNRLVTEGKLKEAIELSQVTLKKFPKSAIALTISQHAQLLEASRIDRIASDMAKATEMIGQIREARLSETKIRAALGRMVSAKFDDVPLDSAMQHLAGQLDIDIVLDPEGLVCEGVTADMPISLNLRKQISAKNLLLLILEPMRLKTEFYAGVLRITGRSEGVKVYVMTYPVSDLRGLPVYDGTGNRTEELGYDELIDLIVSTVAPNSWSKVGGPGAINRYEKNGSLVISNSGEVHQQVAELFVQLRNAARKLPRSLREEERVAPYDELDRPEPAPQRFPEF